MTDHLFKAFVICFTFVLDIEYLENQIGNISLLLNQMIQLELCIEIYSLFYKTHITQITCFVGAYVPLTIEGNIIVSGVLASCYADIHHLTMSPMQRFSAVIEWVLGDDIGFAAHVSTARQLRLMLLPDGHFWSY